MTQIHRSLFLTLIKCTGHKMIQGPLSFHLKTPPSPKALSLFWGRRGQSELKSLGPEMSYITLARTVTWPYLAAKGAGKCSPVVYLGRREDHRF